MPVSISCKAISSSLRCRWAAPRQARTVCSEPDQPAGAANVAIRYAAYGSNLHPVRLGERLPSARLLGSGLLSGYELEFHKRSQDRSGKCSIRPGGSGVHVAVYAISVADKRRLDAIEGVGCGYADTVVDVPGFSDCSTYRAEPAFVDDSLIPYEWYRELVLLGCRFHGFPDAYIARIEAVEAQPDPDAERQQRHRRLLEQISSTLR